MMPVDMSSVSTQHDYLAYTESGALQVKDIVEYAARRYITVVPEIELPGHCGAALACYPHLSCEHPSPTSPYT